MCNANFAGGYFAPSCEVLFLYIGSLELLNAEKRLEKSENDLF